MPALLCLGATCTLGCATPLGLAAVAVGKFVAWPVAKLVAKQVLKEHPEEPSSDHAGNNYVGPPAPLGPYLPEDVPTGALIEAPTEGVTP